MDALVPRTDGPPAELTDEQRAKIIQYFAEHPDAGYKSACRHAGLDRVTQKEAKQLITRDPELLDARLRGMHLDERSAFTAIGEILNDPEHKDRLRAAQWAAEKLHGWGGETTVHHEHSGEVGNPDVAEAVERLNALVAAARVRAAAPARPGELPRGAQ